MSGNHLCSFRGERLPPLEADPPFTALQPGYDAEGHPAMVKVTVTPKAPKPPRCDFETPQGQCTKQSVGGARYPWGCVALCAKHLDEECGS